MEAVHADWSARGAGFLRPPRDRGAEIRCDVRDPDGNLIEVGQTNRAFLHKLAGEPATAVERSSISDADSSDTPFFAPVEPAASIFG